MEGYEGMTTPDDPDQNDAHEPEMVEVPLIPTPRMLRAARSAMGKYQADNPNAPWVSNLQKHAMRWRAMVDAWRGEKGVGL